MIGLGELILAALAGYAARLAFESIQDAQKRRARLDRAIKQKLEVVDGMRKILDALGRTQSFAEEEWIKAHKELRTELAGKLDEVRESVRAVHPTLTAHAKSLDSFSKKLRDLGMKLRGLELLGPVSAKDFGQLEDRFVELSDAQGAALKKVQDEQDYATLARKNVLDRVRKLETPGEVPDGK